MLQHLETDMDRRQRMHVVATAGMVGPVVSAARGKTVPVPAGPRRAVVEARKGQGSTCSSGDL